MDLLVLECFKANFPEYYQFIRTSKELFLRDYLDEKALEYTNDREDALKEAHSILIVYPESIRSAIRNLTMHLFPKFAFNNTAEAKLEKSEVLTLQKRISSSEYFDRYFTFSVKSDEIPDTHFAQYYIENSGISTQDIVTQLEKDFEKYSLTRVALKFATNRSLIKDPHALKVIEAFCLISNRFEEAEAFDLESPFKLLALSIDTMIRSLPEEKRYLVALDAVRYSRNLLFAAELTARFVMPISETDKNVLFKGEQAIEIKKLYIDKLWLQMSQKGFFNAIPEQYMVRQLVWWYDVEDNSLQEEISKVFKMDEDASLKLLRIFTPTLHTYSTGSNSPVLIKANFYETEYERLDRVVGDHKIFKKLTERYGDLSNLPSVHSTGFNDALDDNTLIGKFQELFKLKNLPRDDHGLLRKDD